MNETAYLQFGTVEDLEAALAIGFEHRSIDRAQKLVVFASSEHSDQAAELLTACGFTFTEGVCHP